MNTKNIFLKISLLSVVVLFFTITSCNNDNSNPKPLDYYKIMTEYMVANNMDLDDVLTDWTISAHDLDSLKDNYYIIDIRSAADFAAGHIADAHNTTLANILTEAKNANRKPIVVTCYTGQAAAHGVVALRLSGYSDAKSLLFGMSSWNSVFDHWTANVSDVAVGNSGWSTTNTIEPNVTYSLPKFSSTKTTGAEILAEHVQAILDAGFMGISNSDVLENPTKYFINNYWSEAAVNTYGHIVGSHRIMEDLTLAKDGFKFYDKDIVSVTYCWTGQGSSAVTAYLNILGFNAKSLKFGANGMIHSELQAHKWVGSGDYSYVTD